MYSHLVNWDNLENKIHSIIINAKTIEDLKPAITMLLNGIGDMHGRIIDAKDNSTIAYVTDYENLHHPDKRMRDPKMWEIVNDTSQHFEYKVLNGNIGYVKIVGIVPNVDIQVESEKIRNAIIKLSKNKIDKWIIDLRHNGGGNMHPMVTGIAPLIGDGKVGSLTTLKEEKIFDWEIKNSNFMYQNNQLLKLPNKPKFKKQPKIAVLTSKYTVSSGELVATCFKGRPNTRFFGEATGSLTTNNNWEIIRNEVIINISTGIYCDRNGNSYPYNIPVDEEIPFPITLETEADECVIAAKK